MPTDTATDNTADWAALPVSSRAELLLSGTPFPGETAEEKRCRLKAALGLFDDDDLMALTGSGEDALIKRRVNGTGPRPIRVLRQVFYTADDVRDWLNRNRDALVEPQAKPKR
jgi:hypothetical protein